MSIKKESRETPNFTAFRVVAGEGFEPTTSGL